MDNPIKCPRSVRGATPTVKDREALDFGRYLHPPKFDGQPAPGLPYQQLLSIATTVCKRTIHDLGEVKTKGEVKKILKEMERQKRK
jgi:hypothetical protein